MYTFRNVSIQRKLTLIVMLPSTVALLLACLAFFVYDAVQLRRAMVQEVTMLSQVIGADNTAALVFDDPKSVTDNLALLSANSHVAASCIFTPKGTVFGSYIRSDLRERLTLPPPQADGYAFGAEYLTMYRRIEFNNKTVGTSYVQYDLAALRSRMHDYLGMAVIVLLTSSCVILVLSSWLTRTISEPVLSLAKIAKDISQEKNYSVRAEEHGHDEIGVLINGFNEMLEQIQERDLKLARHSEELEKQVAARTAELEVSNANLRTQMMENEKIQEELFKTRQLESLGILAGGIAHDFNNLLTAILGNVSLAKRRISRGDEISGNLAGIETAGIRANDLTRQLLTFSKGGAPIKELASIEDVIGDSAQFVFRGATSRCSVGIAAGLWPVEVDKGQISQVIHNLALNALQAMPDGGEAAITAENVAVGPDTPLAVPPGRYIRISVRDSGTGIPKEHLSQIFTPYFTTKQQGSGLGLATSYSIIRKHNGDIVVESEPGVGTAFHIYLPASEQELPDAAVALPTRTSGTGGRILVMDDEAIVRNVTREMLSHAGYQVDCAEDGATALEMYAAAERSGSPYELVIMDLTIPGGMGGKEAVEKLRRMAPDARVIAASGYAHGPIMSNFKQYGFTGVLAKPFRLEDLCEAIHTAFHDPKET